MEKRHLILRDAVAEPGGNLFGFRDSVLLWALECKCFDVSLFSSLPAGKTHPALPRLEVQVLAALCLSAGPQVWCWQKLSPKPTPSRGNNYFMTAL